MPPVIVAVGAMAAGAWAASAIGAVVVAGVTISANMIGATVAMGVSILGNLAANAVFGSSQSQAQAQLPTYEASAFQNAQGYLLNKQSNNEPIPVIYGSRLVGGTIVFIEVTGDSNEYLHLVIVLCEGPISAINTVYLNDVASTDAKYTGYVDIYKHLGADDQAADTNLMSATSKWTENHRLRGVAYIYACLKWDQDVFSGGLPIITADVDGRTVYDPRDATTKFSRNPPLCIRDYVTNARYGRGLDTALVPDASIISAANYCEEDVTVGAVTQDRYTCDGIVDIDDTPLSIVGKLLTSCRGWLVFTGGIYKLLIDKPEAATSFEFNEDNITGSWRISGGSKKNTYNRLRVNFFNPDASWQADKTSVESTVLRALDNGVLLEKTIDLPFTADINTARQLATIALNQSRQQIACQFRAFIVGMRCEVGNVVPITHSTPGWAAKNFRILRISLRNDDEVEITAIEYDETSYDYGTIQVVDATPNTNLPDMTIASPPVNVRISEELYYTMSGKGVQTRAIVSWEAPRDAFVASYEVEFKLSADSSWTYATATKARQGNIDDLAPGKYDFRVRSINTMGVSSAYSVLTNQSLSGLTTPPADIQSFIVRPMGGQAHLQWQRSEEMDVIHGGHVKIRFSNVMTGTSWECGIEIASASGASTGVTVTLMSGTYMAKAVDSSGNYSETAAMAVTNMSDILSMNYVAAQEEHPGFTGSKTNMIVDENILMLQGDDDHILLEDGDNILTEICAVSWRLLDESSNGLDAEDGSDFVSEEYEEPYGYGGLDLVGSPAVCASGTYLFSTYYDLGAVYKSRLTAQIEQSGFALGDEIDLRDLNIDDWTGFDGAPTEYTHTRFFVRTTPDDPAGTPTWSDWLEFVIIDLQARAYQFKIEAYTENTNYNIGISALSALIDMPDRSERGQSVVIPVGGKSIVFTTPFKGQPAIGLTINDMESGDYHTLSSQTRQGFDIVIKNSVGSSVERSIDWSALGYGGEITS